MNTAAAQKAQIPDVAGQITFAMRSMGVAPIPRNYELFYEAYIGSNPALTRDLAALGGQATQEELDELGSQYFTHSPARVFDDVHSRIAAELEGLLRVLRQEQTSLESATTSCSAKPTAVSTPRTPPVSISSKTPSPC